MSKKLRIRGSAGSVTLPEKPMGEYIDRKGNWARLYFLGANWALHQIDRDDPATETAVELVGAVKAAEWLASHGCDVPKELWVHLRGRYDFDDDGKPIIPALPKRKGRTTNNARDKFAYDAMKRGETLEAIKNQIDDKDEWEKLYTLQGVSQAAKRYANATGKPWPI